MEKKIRIANSKFSDPRFTMSIPKEIEEEIAKAENKVKSLFFKPENLPQQILNIYQPVFFRAFKKNKSLQKSSAFAWGEVHKMGWFKNREGRWVKIKKFSTSKKFQYQKSTPADPRDNHTHNAAFDEDGNGGTSEAGNPVHVHAVFGFKVQPFYQFDPETGTEYVSVHPGSIAFSEADKKSSLGEFEMEIFRAGTHNGDDFTEGDLAEIASNFTALKGEIRPKLKITHHGEEKEQLQLAGLASYGDITDVFLKKVDDGPKRLFAKVNNVPQEVLKWIKDRRFPERSIEIYPEFKLGTDEKSPVYKNVLKAVALLGHEMPAVTGMEPIKLEECLECQGTECVIQKFEIVNPSGASPDTHIVDENRGSLVPSHEEIEGDEGTVKCPGCQFDIPIEKLENDNTGYSQCPQCGRMFTTEDLEGSDADVEEMAHADARMKILKSDIDLTREVM